MFLITFYSICLIEKLFLANLRKKDFIEGDIVKVILKNCVYRAEIKNINANSIGVLNVDIGNCDLIQSDSIYELPDNLKKVI